MTRTGIKFENITFIENNCNVNASNEQQQNTSSPFQEVVTDNVPLGQYNLTTTNLKSNNDDKANHDDKLNQYNGPVLSKSKYIACLKYLFNKL